MILQREQAAELRISVRSSMFIGQYIVKRFCQISTIVLVVKLTVTFFVFLLL